MSAQQLLRALGWPPHHRIDVETRHGMLVICSASGGRHQVGSRGDLPLPANARHMCRIEPGQPVLLAAIVTHDLLVVLSRTGFDGDIESWRNTGDACTEEVQR
ncbi:hypothetical protein F8271_28000 [Micromonospora sp. ALFpr18c]|uniref:hypothetical protein n=1 Tax=unclassified Micromonospora TaxID=2617518 RepID=UPI00124B66F0|nr:hypothetical protein [Micromonospora sp. ALFpr18c]KAB1929934.1 hypothetical protein F8271_28000 [Micromonospora sp. ALFpr18c]